MKLLCMAARRPLPVEILDRIFRELTHNDLYKVLQTTHLLHDIAIPIVYRSITDLDPRQTIRLACTLCQNSNTPPLGSFIRKLDVTLSGSSLTGNAYVLLNRALRRLTALTYLTLELPSQGNTQSLGWLLNGCTFSLQYFSTSLLYREVSEFLDRQPTITELCLRGSMVPMSPTLATPIFTLPSSSLPKLSHLRAPGISPSVLAEIISGRPLKSISMSLSLQSDAKDALDSLCLGSCPVKRLTLMSFVTMDPGILFREVAERIPELEALHLILMSLYTLESLRLSGPVLTAFKSLKYITFMAYVRPSSIADNDERDIAQLWHRSCPTLQTIILPKGNVWFEQEGNWTPLDM